MSLQGKRIGFAMSASHHNLDKMFPIIKDAHRMGADVLPIVSRSVLTVSTKYGTPEKWKRLINESTGKEPLTTFPEVEPIGPDRLLDVLVVAPCTGSTMARLANAVTDSAVIFAAKSQLRNQRPVVLGISTNDALGLNAGNLGRLMAAQDIYFVPVSQDNPFEKPNSLTAHWELTLPAVEAALENRQLQPLFRETPVEEKRNRIT